MARLHLRPLSRSDLVLLSQKVVPWPVADVTAASRGIRLLGCYGRGFDAAARQGHAPSQLKCKKSARHPWRK